MQSIIYPTAYGSNENMLVCGKNGSLYMALRGLLTPGPLAPTGAVRELSP
jgi:hypothetical protein